MPKHEGDTIMLNYLRKRSAARYLRAMIAADRALFQ